MIINFILPIILQGILLDTIFELVFWVTLIINLHDFNLLINILKAKYYSTHF